MRSISIVAVLLFIAATSISQTRVVQGVLTAYNNYPLANIEVMAKKSKSSTISDSLGNFSIVCNEKDQIKIKAETFKAVSRKIDKHTDTLRINLIFMDSKKNRDVAVGYGYMKEEDLTFAAEHMQQENNEYCSYTNIYELIVGRFAGVTVTGTAGSYKVLIRGAQSFNASNEPLFVVDGAPAMDVSGISPCNVSSIDVIKDGMSSIYGVRGANGVILIETMQGR